MTKLIYRPEIGFALQEQYDLKGSTSISLEQFLLPVHVAADTSLASSPVTVRHAQASFFQAAVAAQRAVFRFEMPGNALASIDRLVFMLGAPGAGAQALVVARHSSTIPAPATVAPKRYTDGRLLAPRLQEPAGVLVHGTQVASVVGATWQKVMNPDLEYAPKHWVVGTGRRGVFGFLEFSVDLVNTELRAAIEWTEYQVT